MSKLIRGEQPTVIRCKNCKDEIRSKYSGHFNWCSCFRNDEGNKGVAIDEKAPYYCRIIGENFEIIEEENDGGA